MKKAFILFIVCLAGAFTMLVPAQAQQQVTVPNVVGMPADQAIKAIQSLGLRAPVSVEGMTPDQKQAGKITKQNPAAGQKVVAGGAVTLYTVMYQQAPTKVTVAPNVMAAFEDAVMPNLYHLTYAQAKDALEKVGLSYEKATKDFSTVRTKDPSLIPGQIQEQRPGAGTRIPKSTVVYMRGYSYQPPPPVTVPDLRNMPYDKAQDKLHQLGLIGGGGSTPTARPELNRVVAAQSIAPGTVVPRETQVSVTYWLYSETYLEVKAEFMPDARTYLLMVRGGVQPYDVMASYDVPKGVKTAPGQKIVTITPLTDNPKAPGWKLYRITNIAPVEAIMKITDAKGKKHDYKLHLTQAHN